MDIKQKSTDLPADLFMLHEDPLRLLGYDN